jgi:uncharacterized membrane protein YhaH (DUF805 family)
MMWFLLGWKRAADFSGRSRRKEYWMFQLFNILIASAVGVVAHLIGGEDGLRAFSECVAAYGLVCFVPQLSLTVRRLHDIGKSGWWYLITLIPLIGGIILFVFTVLDSDPDRNEYGPNPKVPGYDGVII